MFTSNAACKGRGDKLCTGPNFLNSCFICAIKKLKDSFAKIVYI